MPLNMKVDQMIRMGKSIRHKWINACVKLQKLLHVIRIVKHLILFKYYLYRFVAIRFPLKARTLCTVRHARIVIIGVWVISFLLAVPVISGIVSIKAILMISHNIRFYVELSKLSFNYHQIHVHVLPVILMSWRVSIVCLL